MKMTQVFLVMAAWSIAVFALKGQEPLPVRTEAKPNDSKPLMEYVNLVEVRVVGADQPVKAVSEQLFRYTDEARQIAEGGIWAWGEGRPVAVIKSWRNPDGRRTRAFSLTSNDLVTAHGPQALVWQPKSLQFAAKPLTGAAEPDRSDIVRLRQLKEQARRFSAYEMWDPENSRFEMRLLVQPVHRYRDDTRKIADGAVFLLAVDNNPQIVLLIEMLAEETNGSRWQYLLARVSSAELHVALDGQEVWAEGRTRGIVGSPSGPYWHMVTKPFGGKAP
jgi:hypothetical protein